MFATLASSSGVRSSPFVHEIFRELAYNLFDVRDFEQRTVCSVLRFSVFSGAG